MLPIITVLDRPQNPANVGAVVRAVRNMGFADLRLVNPAPFERAELLRYAHRCDDLVASLTIHPTLDEALADVIFVVGTAAQPHPERPHTSDVRALAMQMVTRAQVGPIAIVFGTEGDGLDRAALDRCHLIASLPVNPDYPALNLAQSALLFLYELRQAAHSAPLAKSAASVAPAKQAELAQLFALTGELLHHVDFFRYSPKTVMRDLRTLAHRATLTSAEASLLMGIVRKVQRRVK